MFLSWNSVALSLLPAGLGDAAGPGTAAVLQASLQLAAEGAASAGGSLGSMASGAGAVVVPALNTAAVGADVAVNAVNTGVTAAADVAVAAHPHSMALDPLEVFVRQSGPLTGSVVEGFSFLAVATSFIGTTLSLSGEPQ